MRYSLRFIFQKIFSLVVFLILCHCSVNGKEKKFLILAEGNDWLPIMPKNFVHNHNAINKLPFDGFVIVGNSFTNIVMRKDISVTEKAVWNEVKIMKGLFKKKQIFLQMNLDFPGDFWDDKAWKQVTKNFKAVAKAAKKGGFKGVIFDDEPYTKEAFKMCNFKFPTTDEVKKNPSQFKSWEKSGAEPSWVDKKGYRNPKYSFKEHMKKVQERFATITKAMISVFPNITILVYNGPSFAHNNTNKPTPLLTDVGLPREHEYKGAIFAGFLAGLSRQATLHDMGESYKYRRRKEFERSYKWRKFGIAKNKNNKLDDKFNWDVPKNLRKRWSKKVNVGFMVFNVGEESNYPQFDTRKRSSCADIGNALKLALKRSDKYVIYYCHKQDWLMPERKRYPIPEEWLTMMNNVSKEK